MSAETTNMRGSTSRPAGQEPSIRRFLFNGLLAILVVAIILFFLMPILWMVSISLKSRLDILASPPTFFAPITFANYERIFADPEVIRGFVNSVVLTTSTLLLSFLIGIPAAYALARYQFPGKRLFLMWILFGLMIPLMALVIPFYLVYQRLGLLDTHLGLILVYLIIDLPFVIWMMWTFLKQLPTDLDEAAFIDGCSVWQVIVWVLLPIAKPGLAAAAISCAIATWNEFLLALILTRTTVKTAPVVIVSYMSSSGARWGEMAAMAVLLMLPAIIFGISIQRYYMQGLTAGAVKS
jgi:multiple sugar transport system permease protein